MNQRGASAVLISLIAVVVGLVLGGAVLVGMRAVEQNSFSAQSIAGGNSQTDPTPEPEPREPTFVEVAQEVNPYILPLGTAGPKVKKKQPIAYGPKRGEAGPDGVRPRLVYLTYDDGPAGYYSREIAKELQKVGLTATFFVNGVNVTTDGKSVMRDIMMSGSTLAGHSWSHPDMGRWSEQAVGEDLDRMEKLIQKTVGAQTTCWRAPYGSIGPGAIAAATARGMQSAGWAIDPVDWREPGASVVTNSIASNLAPGAIILLHDGAGHGAQALQVTKNLIPILKAQGYTTGQLCPMIAVDGPAAS